MSLRGGRPERSECSASAVEGSRRSNLLLNRKSLSTDHFYLKGDCFGLAPSQRHKMPYLTKKDSRDGVFFDIYEHHELFREFALRFVHGIRVEHFCTQPPSSTCCMRELE